MKRQKSTKTLLGPVATQFASDPTGTWRTQHPQVDFSTCVRCGICAEYCPTGVITILPEGDQTLTIDWEYCKGCGICATLCPRESILMVPEGENYV